MPGIMRLDPRHRQVLFEDGQKLRPVDHILFCTGYTFSQPFIKAGYRARVPMFPDGPTIDNLYEHMIYKAIPSLAFLGIVQGGAPTFLVVQAQAAFLSRLWAGRLAMEQPVRLADDENPRHSMPYPQFMDYLLRLERACEHADKGLKENEENLPFKWTLELDWIRQNRRGIRDAFIKLQETEDTSTNNLTKIGFSAKRLTPSSQNITQVIPFLLLHAGYFPDRQLKLLKAFFPLRKHKARYPGSGFFDQVKTILPAAEAQLRPGSRQLFREGAKRLLEFGLRRVEEAITHAEDQNEQKLKLPKTASKGRSEKGTVKTASKTTGFSKSLREHQRKMKATFTGLFGQT